jgi:hypothetical protein
LGKRGVSAPKRLLERGVEPPENRLPMSADKEDPTEAVVVGPPGVMRPPPGVPKKSMKDED